MKMFTLKIILENRHSKVRGSGFYCGRKNRAIVLSSNCDCARLFKNISSVKNIKTRLYKRYALHPRFEMTGHEISIINK